MRQGSRGVKTKVDARRTTGGSTRKPPKAKVQAKRVIAKKPPKRKGSKDRESENRLAGALEREKAIGEILRVMSVSPGDVQPVLEAVAERAAHLCDAPYANVLIRDGEMLRPSASSRLPKRTSPLPLPLTRGSVNGRAVLDCKIVHHADIVPLLDTEYPDARQNVQRVGHRAILAVPLLREGEACGTITVFRREPRPFAQEQIALVETFAQQAVIAIDNARLFNETKEGLEQQTATSEILRVISRSPTDAQPVFDTIANAALKLCRGNSANVVRFDGERIHLAALANLTAEGAEAMRKLFPRPPSRDIGSTRAVLTASVVAIPDVLNDPDYALPPGVVARFRSVLAVPLLQEGRPIGAIGVGRAEPGLFPEKQVALLQTFADQAVIAIENARLFNETREALERQTATSEILRVISRSPTTVQPIFDTIANAALKLCNAATATVHSFDGELIHLTAIASVDVEKANALRKLWPKPPGRDTAATRAILSGSIVVIPDVLEERDYKIGVTAASTGFRSVMSVPLIREGKPIGAIAVGRPEPGRFPGQQIALLQTFADQAVIAIENVRLFDEVQAHARDLSESLHQQTATADVLKVISRSAFDLQTVLDTLTESACRLCEAETANLWRPDSEGFKVAAMFGHTTEHRAALKRYVIKPARDTCVGRTLLEVRTVHIQDAKADPEYSAPDLLAARGNRAMVGVPLLREGVPIGVLVLTRTVAQPFTEKQIALATTFADQAVIAIENVRLFNETNEALERQTATSDILRVISQSPTDVRPVFDTIVEAALRLCEATSANVVTFDGELIHVAAFAPVSPEGGDAVRHHFASYPRPPSRDTANTRAILTRSVVVIPDVLEDSEYAAGATAIAAGYRSVLSVPLMREESPIGAITVARAKPGPFPDKQVSLLKTFADQAVIAIENVRLFTELTQKNRALTQAHAQVSETLERQTATSEILDVISRSPTEVQPVFETIATAAMKLCGGNRAHVFTSDGKQLHIGALASANPSPDEEIRKRFPRRLGNDLAASRAILTGGVIVITDVLKDPEYALKELAPAGGFRSVLAVPLLREGSPMGAIAVSRSEPGPFPENQIALLQTFAAQAVIAIENVRLFNETKEALEQQTATSEILRVISRSPRDVQPVFDTIAAAALKLCNAGSSNVVTYDGELVHVAAQGIADPQGAAAIRNVFPRRLDRGTAATRAMLACDVVAVPDVLDDPEISTRGSAQLAGGFRSVLAVPLILAGKPIGAIAVGRSEPGTFADKQVALLRTFADQAVIAIENVRLFTELETRTLQLTRSVNELTALGEVGQAVSSTLDLETVLATIVSRASQLAGMDGGSIWEYNDAREEFHLHATDRFPSELVEVLRSAPIRKGEGAVGRLAVTGELVEIRDIAGEQNYPNRLRDALVRSGYRSALVVPLLREEHLLGALAVNRSSPGEFAEEVIALLKTFATQSALAIQNARLYREIEVKSRELETASRHKSEFLANMSHELRTPLNAIIGFSEVLSERMFGEINEKQAEYISDILQSGQHLLSLINDILDLSKIEAGRMELELGEFDLSSTIDTTLLLVRERAERRGISLTRAVDERFGMIRADERKVKQVLLNLLSNALKFTPEGGKIDVRAAASDSAAEISVADTGVGIAPEDQAAVFEEFRQVGTASKKVEGTGLGLAISRKFIELHGGRIWVTSQVGTGSTFTFTLPLQEASPT